MCKLMIRYEPFEKWLERHPIEQQELYKLAPELVKIRYNPNYGWNQTELLYRANSGMSSSGELLTDLYAFGAWRFERLQGAEAAVWISGVWLNKEFQGRGLGSLLHKLRLQYLKDMGYLVAHCCTYTPIPGMRQPWEGRTKELAEKRRHILLKHGWVEDYTYESPQEANTVTMWHKVL